MDMFRACLSWMDIMSCDGEVRRVYASCMGMQVVVAEVDVMRSVSMAMGSENDVIVGRCIGAGVCSGDECFCEEW